MDTSRTLPAAVLALKSPVEVCLLQPGPQLGALQVLGGYSHGVLQRVTGSRELRLGLLISGVRSTEVGLRLAAVRISALAFANLSSASWTCVLAESRS